MYPTFSKTEAVLKQAKVNDLQTKIVDQLNKTHDYPIEVSGTYIEPPPAPLNFRNGDGIYPTVKVSEGIKEMADREAMLGDMAQQGLINSYIQQNLVPIDQGKLAATNPLTGQVQVHEIHSTITPAQHPGGVAPQKAPQKGLEEATLPATTKVKQELPPLSPELKNILDTRKYKLEGGPKPDIFSDLSPVQNNDFEKGKIIKFNDSKSDVQLQIPDGYSAEQVKFALPPQIRSLFANRGKFVKSHLIPKLKSRLTRFVSSSDGKLLNPSEQTQYKNLLRTIISQVESLPDGSSVQFEDPSIEGGSLPVPNINRTLKRDNLPFGRYLIDRRQLAAGVLSIQDGKRKSIVNMPKKKVTKHMANAIYDIMIGNRPKVHFLKAEEEDFLKSLIDRSYVNSAFEEPLVPEGDRLKDELEAIVGEMELGNDSMRLKQRLSDIITYLYNSTNFSRNTLRNLSKYLE